jgi:hypothetical protein
MSSATPTMTHRVKTRLPDEYQGYDTAPEPLADFLGLFSVGLGLWEVLDPRGVADATGVRYPGLLRAYGLREIAAGVGILSNRRPAGWLWARVAGDVLDLATIAAAYAEADEEDRRKALLAAAAVAGVTALDVLAAQQHS